MYKRPHAPRDSVFVTNLLARVVITRLDSGQTLEEVRAWICSPSVARQYGPRSQRAVRTVLVGSR